MNFFSSNNIFLGLLGILLCSCQPKSTSKTVEASPKNDSVFTLQISNDSDPKMTEEGLNTDYYNNGKEKMKGVIKDGLREGLWQAWYETGVLWSEADYVKGVNHGKSITYFENGKIRYEGTYNNGKKIGIWKYYDEEGKLVKTINN
jgi:antitoxin component YwqK of YwqJK toxin-antitoxin module